jgi:hypothetical protein
MENIVKPVRPSEVVELKKNVVLPPKLIEVWNTVIAKNYSNKRSQFTQEEILLAVMKTLDVDRKTVFSNKWLDVEEVYRAEGWIVVYDQPGYNENYEATFTFTHT